MIGRIHVLRILTSLIFNTNFVILSYRQFAKVVVDSMAVLIDESSSREVLCSVELCSVLSQTLLRPYFA